MKNLTTTALIAAAIVAPVAANAQTFGAAANYNLFSLGSTNFNVDIEGNVASAGNVSASNYEIAAKTSGSSTALVSGGNVNLNGGTVHGSVDYAGTYSASNSTVNGTVSKSSPVDFTAAGNYLKTASTQLSELASNGTVQNKWGNLYLTGTDATRDVFTISADQLNTNYMEFDVPPTATLLINVTGTTAGFSYGGINVVTSNGTYNVGDRGNPFSTQILWNFSQATSLNLRSTSGSILAPFAAVTSDYGAINGQVIAGSYSGNIQINDYAFGGNLPAINNGGGNHTPTSVPEPTSMAVLGVGALGLLRRKRKAA